MKDLVSFILLEELLLSLLSSLLPLGVSIGVLDIGVKRNFFVLEGIENRKTDMKYILNSDKYFLFVVDQKETLVNTLFYGILAEKATLQYIALYICLFVRWKTLYFLRVLELQRMQS